MNFYKTSFFSGLTTLIKVCTGFITGKILSIYLGPAGIAQLGNFYNYLGILNTISSGGINNGVVKYASEWDKNIISQRKLFLNSLIIIFITNFILLIFISLGIDKINIFDFVSNHLIVYSLLLSALFFSINNLFISFLNGLKEIKKMSILNIITSIVNVIITVILVKIFLIKGVILSFIFSSTFVFILMFIIMYKKYNWINFNIKLADISILKNLIKYGLMAFVTAFTIPIVQLVIREYITKNIGIDAAGIWQGLLRISDGYLMIFSTILITYFLPKYSSIQNDYELKEEIKYGFKIITPTVFLLCILVYLFRDIVISIFYTSKFSVMSDLFSYHLIGDFFKINSWILAYLMLAKSKMKAYIFTEILFSFSLVLLSLFLIKKNGLIGVSMAYAINYFLYFIAMLVIYRKLILLK